jgi:polyisoprenoid-binding protein YceI
MVDTERKDYCMSNLADLTPGVWTVDPAHSGLNFTVKHLMVSKVRGRFKSFSGTIVVDGDVLKSSVTATAQVVSVDTNDESRDEHLRTGDFFDVEKYPNIELRSTKIEKKGDDYVLYGDLTIKDVTKNVKFELEFEGVGKDPWGNIKVGFTAETEINRKDFGLEYNAVLETGGVLIGEKVKIELDVQAVKA